jgi:hypothetical protein
MTVRERDREHHRIKFGLIVSAVVHYLHIVFVIRSPTPGMRPPGRAEIGRLVWDRLGVQMIISQIAIVPQRIPVPGKIESINANRAGEVKVRNDASGIAAVRIVTAPGFDLALSAPVLAVGLSSGPPGVCARKTPAPAITRKAIRVNLNRRFIARSWWLISWSRPAPTRLAPVGA